VVRIYTVKEQRETLSPWEMWRAWAAQNYVWLLPIVASIAGPIAGSLMNILYDWIKTKRRG